MPVSVEVCDLDTSAKDAEAGLPEPKEAETYTQEQHRHSLDALRQRRQQHHNGGPSDPHHHHHLGDTIISHRAEGFIELRLEDLEHNQLAHKPKPIRPGRALLVNLWVLLLAAGVLAVILLAQSRLHVAEPLEHVHAINGAEPYFISLGPTPITYLFVATIVAPWHGAAGDTTGGYRHRLLSSAGADDDHSLPAHRAAAALQATDPAALRMLKQHLGKARRVLAAAAGSSDSSAEVAPQLTVQIMQKNVTKTAPRPSPAIEDLLTSVIPPTDYGMSPVSREFACQLKDGASVKCNIAITSSHMLPALRPGENLYLVFSLDTPGQVAFEVHESELGKFGYAKNWVALAILLLMLIGIASEKVHRLWCAMIAAFAMMSLLLWMNMAPSLAKVTEFLDESTLGLLFGMMILVGKLKDTGLFEVMCAATLKACKGKMWLLSVLMCYITALVSAFLDNVTTMLLMGPITVSMMKTCSRDPRPLLIAQVIMSNVGGTATMIGDPPNIIIGTALQKYLSFGDFIVNLAPGVIAASIPAVAVILLLYRSTLTGLIPDFSQVLQVTSQFKVTDWDLMAKSGYVVTAVVVGFLLHPLHHLDPAWFAIIGAVLLCVITSRLHVEEIMHSVEWDMLLFFAALFVMVEGAAEVGMIDMLGGWLEAIIRAAPEQSRTLVAVEILLWASAFISGILDNIPYTTTMVPVIEYLAASGLGLDLKTLAWALAFGACFGGNATLVGASANIVTATLLEKQGHPISFVGWMKVGVPVTIITVAVANVYMLRYVF